MRTFFPLLLATSVASAQPTTAKVARIAVVPVAAVNIDQQRVDALAQDLAEALSGELEVDAIGGLDVRRVIRADLPADCATLPSCAAEVAKATSADQILFVVMVDAGGSGSLQVDSTWVEPSTGKTGTRPSVSLSSTLDADAKARFHENAQRFLPDAKVREKPKAGGSSLSVSDAKPRHFTNASLVTGGVTIAGLGVGIGFGLAARSKYNNCDAAPNTCSQSRKDGIKHLDLAADIGWAAALGGAIATSIMFATSGEESHVIAAPMENGASVSYFGRF